MKTGPLIEDIGVIQDFHEASTPPFEDDPRWQLIQRIIASRHFARAPLLSKFLAHISLAALQQRTETISEYHIGIHVFDRPIGYKTVEDNIVRNYARQLRKRLAEYFASEGNHEIIRIEVPIGGYIPVFHGWDRPALNTASATDPQWQPATQQVSDHASAQTPNAPRQHWRNTFRPSRGSLRLFAFVTLYSAALIAITIVLLKHRQQPAATPHSPSHALWNSLLHSSLNTFLVPTDSGLNILQDISQSKLDLAAYLHSDYLSQTLPAINQHSASDLRTQQYTSYVDMQVLAMLMRLPELDPQRMQLRFPRDLRMDDLKNSNVILLGSVTSNPWAEVAQKSLNFRILSDNQMQRAWVANTHPQPGEAASYVSHWNEPAHDTYAVIAYLPNLSHNGHLLLIQGLDVAGTQAAAETLMQGEAIAPILRQASQSDGGIRPFEILLQSKSIESNAANTQVIASRIY